MTDSKAPNWAREIFAAEIKHDGHEVSGTYVLSEHATLPRWDGDDERDRQWQCYVDKDIYDSAEKYWRQRVDAEREAALTKAADVAQHHEDHEGLDQDGNPYVSEEVHLFGVGVAFEIKQEILALIPQPSALDEMLAEAERKGMERAMRIANTWSNSVNDSAYDVHEAIRAEIEKMGEPTQ